RLEYSYGYDLRPSIALATRENLPASGLCLAAHRVLRENSRGA
ncbi:MAG: hypothetical protein QOI08_3848, partial [Actinomycetota bacterium]|nr:hypothetical protein [Actinomycetota bacterium]